MPLVKVLSLGCFVSGIMLYQPISEFFPAPWLLFLLPAPLFFLKDRRVFFSVLFLSLGLVLTHHHLRVPRRHLLKTGLDQVAVLKGRIVTEPDTGPYATELVLSLCAYTPGDGVTRRASGLIHLKLPRHDYLATGDVIMVPVKNLQEIKPPANPGSFDEREFWERKQVFLEGTGTDVRVIRSGRNPWTALLLRTKARIRNMIKTYFRYQPEEAALVETLCIGKVRIPGFLKELGRKTGTYHLLVISGLHLGFLFWLLKILAWPFCTLRDKHPKVFPAVALAVLWFYAGLTGGKVPVVRATLMFSFFLAGELLEREISGLESVFWAGFVLLLANPLNLFDAGFQLSFAATVGILVSAETFGRVLTFRPALVRNCLAASLGAQLFSLPFLLYHFGIFYPFSIINNLIAVPLAGVTTVAGFLFVIFPVVFSFPLHVITRLFVRLLALQAKAAPGFHWHLGYPAVLLFLGIACLLVSGRKQLGRKWWPALLSLVLGLLAVMFFHPKPGTSGITFFSDRKILAVLEERQEFAVFASDYDREQAVTRILVPYLRMKGIRKLNSLFFTEVSADHLGTLNQLSGIVRLGKGQAGPVSVEVLYPGRFGSESPVYRLTRENLDILIAQEIGPEGSRLVRDKRFEVVVLGGYINRKEVRENLQSVRCAYLVLPENLKKFSFLDACGPASKFYLAQGAVVVDWARPPFSVFQYGQE